MSSTLGLNPRPAADPGSLSTSTPIAELLDAAPTMLYACGADGSVAFVNQRLREFVGNGAESLLQKKWTGLLDSNDGSPSVHMFLAAQQARREYEFKYRARRRDGQLRLLVDCGHPHLAADGTLIGYVGSVTDITAHDRSADEPAASFEAQLLRNELSHVTRVSMMGELTASLAHELNQPLTAILSNAQAALRMLGDASEVPAELREILRDIALDDQRAGDIIRKVRQLMKKDPFQLQPVDLNKLVVDVSILLESDVLIREMAIERDLAPNLPRVFGDRIQLQQVLLNLILNGLDAMKAMPNDGSRKLIVRTGSDGQKVRIAVTDAGIGLPAERGDLIFEPFFSTKSDGMGMGLSISRSILVAHGGLIAARNNAERGATFEMELPVMTENEP
jgi:PAS domain S-box-containing protein